MEDLVKILIYAGAVIVYFIFKNRKTFRQNTPTTAAPKPQSQPSDGYERDDNKDPFEQLLKEVAQKWEEKDMQKPVYTSSPQTFTKRTSTYQHKPVAYSSSMETSLEGQGERQLKGLMSQAGKNEGMSEDDRSVLEKNKELKRFKEYETQKRINHYHDLAQDPKRLKEAFIMGEILQRKY